MATADQLVEAMKFMADQVAILTQQQLKLNNVNFGRKDKGWDNIGDFKNIKVFAGDSRDWEEFSMKLKSQVAAGSPKAAETLDWVETRMSEAELMEDGYAEKIADEDIDESQVKEIGAKLHNVLLSLTTGEANAVVRRCRERLGLLA